jgi:hypothetical protein
LSRPELPRDVIERAYLRAALHRPAARTTQAVVAEKTSRPDLQRHFVEANS